MENILQQEIIFGTSDSALSTKISRWEKAGKIRKILPRVYSSNFSDSPEEIIRRHLFSLIGELFPSALLSHRSALEFHPTESGHIFITYKYNRKIEWPGLTLNFLQGPPPSEGDTQFSGELWVSRRERAFLENLQVSRKSGGESKTLPQSKIEEKLEQIIRVNGEVELNKVRDRTREIAEKLDFKKEFQKLDKIISALLATQPAQILTSPVAAARAFGAPYDATRLQLFEKLFVELNQREFPFRAEKNTSQTAYKAFAFFESYFSNYIEGTVFELKEAKQVIENQRSLPLRNEDSHDVLGTYQIVSDKKEMSRTPTSGEEWMAMLQDRHRILLSARLSKNPGQFKTQNNRAGQTEFVDFQLVRGTLLKSFDYYRALRHPFAKAAFMMFAVSEIHPFADGNGRIARVMMNAELTAAGQTKIIIPTVYREDYLGALRKLSRQGNAEVYIQMLSRAQAFSATVVGENQEEMEAVLRKGNAFLESTEGVLRWG